MKKLGYFIVGLFAVVLVSGCGSKESLTCTAENAGTGMNVAVKQFYNFENDKVSTVTTDTTFKDIEIGSLNLTWSQVISQFSEQNSPVDIEGFSRTVDSNENDKTFTVTMKIDFNKLSNDNMSKYGISDYSSKSYDDVKKELTDSGMTCK